MNADEFAEVLRNSSFGHKVVEPPDFYGEIKEDPIEWLKEFNRASNSNDWGGKKKLKLIRHYLRGNTGRWYDDNCEEIEDWKQPKNEDEVENFEENFKKKYITRERQDVWFSQLIKLKQGRNESVS